MILCLFTCFYSCFSYVCNLIGFFGWYSSPCRRRATFVIPMVYTAFYLAATLYCSVFSFFCYFVVWSSDYSRVYFKWEGKTNSRKKKRKKKRLPSVFFSRFYREDTPEHFSRIAISEHQTVLLIRASHFKFCSALLFFRNPLILFFSCLVRLYACSELISLCRFIFLCPQYWPHSPVVSMNSFCCDF